MGVLEQLVAPTPSLAWSGVAAIIIIAVAFNVVTRVLGAYAVNYYGPKSRGRGAYAAKSASGYQQYPPRTAMVPPADIGGPATS